MVESVFFQKESNMNLSNGPLSHVPFLRALVVRSSNNNDFPPVVTCLIPSVGRVSSVGTMSTLAFYSDASSAGDAAIT